jgi:uncharacterized protein (UPF0261 family)
MEEMIVELVLGQSGAGVLIALVMGAVKKGWKPDNRRLYWIPAVLLSAVASLGVLWYVGAMNIWLFLLTTAVVSGFEYISQNEMWDLVKAIFGAVVGKLVK